MDGSRVVTDQTSLVAAMVEVAERITVLTGAGVSTESGIPDYRGPNGAWTTNPASMRLVDIGAYLSDPRVRRDAWQERLHHAVWTARPGPAHRAVVDLERAGKLRALLTQNIDGLHQAAGSTPDLVAELHGTILFCRCLGCAHETPMLSQLERVEAGEPDPACEVCGGIQKSATIAFGQSLDPQVLERAIEATRDCDLFLAVGTSLRVMPAAHLFVIARDAGARCVIVNAEPTPFDVQADSVLRGRIGEVLPRIVGSPSGAPGREAFGVAMHRFDDTGHPSEPFAEVIPGLFQADTTYSPAQFKSRRPDRKKCRSEATYAVGGLIAPFRRVGDYASLGATVDGAGGSGR